MFIIDNEVIVSVVNENIQVDFSDNNIPVVVGTIDVVVNNVDNKVIVDNDITVDVGVQAITML